MLFEKYLRDSRRSGQDVELPDGILVRSRLEKSLCRATLNNLSDSQTSGSTWLSIGTSTKQSIDSFPLSRSKQTRYVDPSSYFDILCSEE